MYPYSVQIYCMIPTYRLLYNSPTALPRKASSRQHIIIPYLTYLGIASPSHVYRHLSSLNLESGTIIDGKKKKLSLHHSSSHSHSHSHSHTSPAYRIQSSLGLPSTTGPCGLTIGDAFLPASGIVTYCVRISPVLRYVSHPV